VIERARRREGLSADGPRGGELETETGSDDVYLRTTQVSWQRVRFPLGKRRFPGNACVFPYDGRMDGRMDGRRWTDGYGRTEMDERIWTDG